MWVKPSFPGAVGDLPSPERCGADLRFSRDVKSDPMPRIELNSTGLVAATYQGHLTVLELEFRSGSIYQYFGVSGQTYQELLLAPSKGAYFNSHIRDLFPCSKLHPDQSSYHPDCRPIEDQPTTLQVRSHISSPSALLFLIRRRKSSK